MTRPSRIPLPSSRAGSTRSGGRAGPSTSMVPNPEEILRQTRDKEQHAEQVESLSEVPAPQEEVNPSRNEESQEDNPLQAMETTMDDITDHLQGYIRATIDARLPALVDTYLENRLPDLVQSIVKDTPIGRYIHEEKAPDTQQNPLKTYLATQFPSASYQPVLPIQTLNPNLGVTTHQTPEDIHMERVHTGNPTEPPGTKAATRVAKSSREPRDYSDSSDDDYKRMRRNRSKKNRKEQSRRINYSKKKNKKNRRGTPSSPSDSSPSDSSNDSSDSDESSSSDRHRRSRRLSRRKSLTEFKPLNELFRKAVSYKTYRLRNRNGSVDMDTIRIDKLHRKLKVQMGSNTFDGSDPISVLGFLERFKTACNHNFVHEDAAIWLFQFFLEGQAHAMLQSRLVGSNMAVDAKHRELLTSYPQVVNFLIRNYATDEVIAEAYNEVIGCKQVATMNELRYSQLLWDKALRCGTVFSDLRLKSLFADGVSEVIRAQVRNHLASHTSLDYHALVRYAQAIGESHRKTVGMSTAKLKNNVINKPRQRAFVVESSTSTGMTDNQLDKYQDVNLMAVMGYNAEPPSRPLTSTASPVPTPPLVNAISAGQSPMGKVQQPIQTRCRLCFDSAHASDVCPFVPPQLRTSLLAAREHNYQRLRKEGAFTNRSTQNQYPQAQQAPKRYSDQAMMIEEEPAQELEDPQQNDAPTGDANPQSGKA